MSTFWRQWAKDYMPRWQCRCGRSLMTPAAVESHRQMHLRSDPAYDAERAKRGLTTPGVRFRLRKHPDLASLEAHFVRYGESYETWGIWRAADPKRRQYGGGTY